LLLGLGAASALTPLPDTSPAAWAGEWAGPGEQGSYCHLTLRADGQGWALVDGGSGDWLAARFLWQVRAQGPAVGHLFPAALSASRRTLPLAALKLAGGFNQSLTLRWSERVGVCQLQRVEASARHLQRAREALSGLRAAEESR
jgi:hypothetical protein